ncbi:M81 family metallopeptidase [soil metagenome]
MNIFVAGFHHETNTFAPSPADWDAFTCGAGYPGYARGEAMLAKMRTSSMPIAGFAAEAVTRGWTLLPSVWAGAMPSNRVTVDAFERICGEIIEDLHRGGFEAIYLDLHGAGVAEFADDAEGELLSRMRAVVGPEMPIVASLDLHANVTQAMLVHTTAMTAFRTYPHVDMRETGARAAHMLARRLATDAPARHLHVERVPFLLPLNAQCTLMEPAAGVVRALVELEEANEANGDANGDQNGRANRYADAASAVDSALELNFAMGFSAADFAECGPVLFGYGTDASVVRQAVQRLHAQVIAQRAQWAIELLAPAQAIEQAIALAAQNSAPIVIADTQDNPGAGGDANTTGMLHALIAARAGERLEGRVALGLLFDPESARAAHAAGIGASVTLQLGRAVATWDGALTEPPVQASATVLALSDGEVDLHGPMTAGNHVSLGLCACVAIDGIRVLLSSGKMQMLDTDLYRFLGVAPEQMKLLVVKSSVHFRAAFTPLAAAILVAKSPGPMAADPGDLPWQHLREGMAPRP